jgi:Trk K+ transport system NAD-binding subunit
MRLEFHLPQIVPQMTEATVLRVAARPNEALLVGAALLDLEVDLSKQIAGDCPLVSYYRLVLREPGIVRELPQPGDVIQVGDRVAVLVQNEGTPADAPSRRLRLSIASVLPRWDETS